MPKTIKPSKFTKAEIKKRLSYKPVYKVIGGKVVPNNGRSISVTRIYSEVNQKGCLPSANAPYANSTVGMARSVLSSLGISAQIDHNIDYDLMNEEKIEITNNNIVIEPKDKSEPMTEQEMFNIAPSPTDPLYVMDDSPSNYYKKQLNKESRQNAKIDVTDLVATIAASNRRTTNKKLMLKEFRR